MPPLDPDEEERIAKKVVDYMFARIQQEIGKGVLRKLFWVALGVIVVLAIWTGVIKVPH